MVGGLSWGYVGPSWGYVGPILRAMWAHLGAMLAHLGDKLAHLGAMLAHLGAMLAHLEAMLVHLEAMFASWGLCWPMLTHLEPQDPKNGKKWSSKKHRKNAVVFGVGGRSAAGGAAPLSCGENCRTAMPRPAPGPAAPWPDLSATAGQGPCWGDMGLAGSKILRPMLAHRELQESKNGNSKKHCKTQNMLMVGGLSWGYVGLSWGQGGPILGPT